MTLEPVTYCSCCAERKNGKIIKGVRALIPLEPTLAKGKQVSVCAHCDSEEFIKVYKKNHPYTTE